MNEDFLLPGWAVLDERGPELGLWIMRSRWTQSHERGLHRGRKADFPYCTRCHRAAYERLGLTPPWAGRHVLAPWALTLGTFALIWIGVPLWGGLFVGNFGPGLNGVVPVTEMTVPLILAGLITGFIALKHRHTTLASWLIVAPFIVIWLLNAA